MRHRLLLLMFVVSVCQSVCQLGFYTVWKQLNRWRCCLGWTLLEVEGTLLDGDPDPPTAMWMGIQCSLCQITFTSCYYVVMIAVVVSGSEARVVSLNTWYVLAERLTGWLSVFKQHVICVCLFSIYCLHSSSIFCCSESSSLLCMHVSILYKLLAQSNFCTGEELVAFNYRMQLCDWLVSFIWDCHVIKCWPIIVIHY